MFCGSICRLTHIIFLLNTDVKGTPSQIERLGAIDSVAGPVTLLTLLTRPLSFSSLQHSSASMIFACPSANRAAIPVTLLTLQTLRTREIGRGSRLQSIANKAGDPRGLTDNTRDTADTADSANPCLAAKPRIIGVPWQITPMTLLTLRTSVHGADGALVFWLCRHCEPRRSSRRANVRHDTADSADTNQSCRSK